MKKTTLNEKELHRYEVIRKLVEDKDKGNRKSAAVKLGCSIRTIRRLEEIYRTSGKEGFAHHNRGRSPATRFDDETKRKIIDMYVKDYPDANISHFTEIVRKDLNIKISSETIRLWLVKEKVLSPKAQRRSKKKLKKQFREDLKKSRSKKESNAIKEKIEELDHRSIHPRRERDPSISERWYRWTPPNTSG